MMDNTNDFDKSSPENDETNSDTDYSNLETESNDSSTDEYISKEDDSSDFGSTGNDTDLSNPPEFIEKKFIH